MINDVNWWMLIALAILIVGLGGYFGFGALRKNEGKDPEDPL